MTIIKLLLIYSLYSLFLYNSIHSQPAADIFNKNSAIEQIRKSSIKSKAIWEQHYSKINDNVLGDSGYKSYYYVYDNMGKLTEYTKYQVYSDLTIKEVYSYDGRNNIKQTTRYNSRGDRIETIDFKYSKSGKLKTELHTAFLNSVRKGLYFTIEANINNINGGQLFADLQKDLEIEPIIEGYTITVNITDPEELNQYVVIGDEMDPTSPRFSWSQLSLESQKGLLSYEGPNRKEHSYRSKNTERIIYKYDSKGNLTKREEYNTAGDMIEKESFRYNGDNQLTNYYRYGERENLSSMEIYSYDNMGRMVESSGLDPSGKAVGKLSYKHDDNGNLTEKVWFNMNGEINGVYKYSYDNQNRLIEEIKFRGENERESRYKYSYDENGNILEIVKYNIDDKKDKLIKYIYEYY